MDGSASIVLAVFFFGAELESGWLETRVRIFFTLFIAQSSPAAPFMSPRLIWMVFADPPLLHSTATFSVCQWWVEPNKSSVIALRRWDGVSMVEYKGYLIFGKGLKVYADSLYCTRKAMCLGTSQAGRSLSNGSVVPSSNPNTPPKLTA